MANKVKVSDEDRSRMMFVPVALAAIVGCIMGAVVAAPILARVLP